MFRYDLTVPFYDVDSMEIVWHGNYVKYFEEARCAFFERLGLTYRDMERAGFLLPVVSLSIKYMHPCVFGQRIGVGVDFDTENSNLLVLNYTVTDIATGERLCRGTTRHAAISRGTRELLFELPTLFWERLRQGNLE